MRVGFIGLGLMGEPMARNLAGSGIASSLILQNRTRAKAEALAAEIGAMVAQTPRAVAEQADVVITMVPDVPDVEQVYLGKDGICEVGHPGLLCTDMSTVGADCVRRIAGALAASGAGFVDAPVSGGTIGAQAGTLSIMAGGLTGSLEALRPVFQTMGGKIVHCGEAVGSGQTTKLVNQIVGALNLEAVCEGLVYAGAAGVDIEAVLEAVGAGAAGSWAWSNLGPRMVRADNAPGFKIAHQIKDLRLALEAAEAMGLSLPGLRLVLGHFEQTRDAAIGNGELGTQAMIAAVKNA
ncbi:MAG: NAD(P)-dependent oxidoreductase [Cytophagales bacterium]|nr:NAD(P)-dependent oxidoreductase [Armatimonadota bacterium]